MTSFFGITARKPAVRALAKVRKLIEDCGCHRRDGELKDAEEALGD